MATLMLVNPRKRHGKERKSSRRARARSASRRSRRSYRTARRHNPVRVIRVSRRRARRRNPFSLGSARRFIPAGVLPQLTGAGIGAVGALANDAVMTYVPLPAMLKTGVVGQLTRVVSAFLVGALAGKLVGASKGADMTRGALTIQIYALAKPMVSHVVPLAGMGDADMGYYNPGTTLGFYPGPGALPNTNSGMGNLNPWQSYDPGEDDGDAFRGLADDSIGYYPQA